jgi:hypothetical protein
VPLFDMLGMSVGKMGILVDLLHRDCSQLQFVRELTQNGIEAILQHPDKSGEIRWDVDWNRFELQGADYAQKLCVIDTGVGMTGEEMAGYINKLSSSVHEQSAAGNFGVGAKIAAAPLNPEGLIYLSWKAGQGWMIQLVKDPHTGDYGLLRFDDGEFWRRIQDDIKPEPIDQHGTMVVLLGRDEDEATVEAPPGAKMPKKWVLRYLNSRYFRLPEKISVKVREGWDLPRGDRHSFLRTVTGQGPWLDENSIASGSLRLNDAKATAHWWIINSEADTNSGHYTPGGHVGALFQNELYELVHGPAGYARLQAFGVVFGGDKVVIYVEPDCGPARAVTANTARTKLIIDHDELDWAGCATEFRLNLPTRLRDYQDEIGSASGETDSRKAIQERLRAVQELFRFGRYRPRTGGAFRATPAANTGGTPAASDGSRGEGGGRSGTRGGKKGDIYALFVDEAGDAADLVDLPNQPLARWVTEAEKTRSVGDLEERAARYLPEQHLLLINGDFRAFTDMIDRWVSRYDHVPGCRQTVQTVVREWFEQQLVETVMSALALKQSGKWSQAELADIWSEQSLTAAVLPRYHVDMSIKRVLGQRLGRAPGSEARS